MRYASALRNQHLRVFLPLKCREDFAALLVTHPAVDHGYRNPVLSQVFSHTADSGDERHGDKGLALRLPHQRQRLIQPRLARNGDLLTVHVVSNPACYLHQFVDLHRLIDRQHLPSVDLGLELRLHRLVGFLLLGGERHLAGHVRGGRQIDTLLAAEPDRRLHDLVHDLHRPFSRHPLVRAGLAHHHVFEPVEVGRHGVRGDEAALRPRIRGVVRNRRCREPDAVPGRQLHADGLLVDHLVQRLPAVCLRVARGLRDFVHDHHVDVGPVSKGVTNDLQAVVVDDVDVDELVEQLEPLLLAAVQHAEGQVREVLEDRVTPRPV